MTISPPPELKDTEGPQLLAILEVLYFVAKADGFFSADELRAFLKMATSLSSGKISSTHLNALVTSWGKTSATEVDNRLREISNLLSDDATRRMTRNLASQMAKADGSILASEEHMLDAIAKAFSLT